MLVFFLMSEPVCEAQQRDSMGNNEVIVLFDAQLKPAANEVTALYPAIRTELEKLIGYRCRFRPVIVLIRDEAVFQKAAGHDLFVAFALPRKNHIVIDFSKMGRDPFTLEITLKHELCHLLLHDRIRKSDLPRWLDEGLAQWVCGGISELLTAEKQSFLSEAALVGNYIPFRSLTWSFPTQRTELILAYNQSRSMVTYITEIFGKAALLKILACLQAGDDTDAAVQKSLFMSFQELESQWHQSVKKRTSWFVWLAIHIYDILFFLAALTAVFGFIKLTVRKRTYKDEDTEDEDGHDF